VRVLLYAAELAAVLALVWAGVRGVPALLRRRREQKALRGARWRRRVVPLEDGRIRVEVAKHGVGRAVPVETLDPTTDAFDVALYEAEARADELAISLNAGDEV
jgi:hypothetical protein